VAGKKQSFGKSKDLTQNAKPRCRLSNGWGFVILEIFFQTGTVLFLELAKYILTTQE
jgi:hypothetical protein